MRVVHIITRMIIGGAQENTLFNCCDLVQEHGDEVFLMTGPETGPEGNLLEQGRGGGVELMILDRLRRPIRPFQDRAAWLQIRQSLAKLKPDVVHTHSAKGGFLGRSAAWSLRIPCVVHTVHGAPFHPYQSFLSRQFFIQCERWAAKRCHHLISVADAMTDLMVRAKVAPRSKFTTIYSGMAVEPFLDADQHRETWRAQLGYSPEHVVVGKIARLFYLKGHEYLIQAAKLLCDDQPNLRYLLIGDGILRQPLEKRIRDLGLQDRFHFLGLVPTTEIPAVLGTIDLLVHTSLREGLARALPQALLAGKPVISYDIDGAKEVVVDNETGFLVPPQSVESLAEAIRRLAVSPDLRMRMGAIGRALCEPRFRHQGMTIAIRSLYEKVLGGA